MTHLRLDRVKGPGSKILSRFLPRHIPGYLSGYRSGYLWLAAAALIIGAAGTVLARGDAPVDSTAGSGHVPHPHEMTPLSPEGPFPRFTPEVLRAAGYPDHLHAYTWHDWSPPVDSEGIPYGPGSLCRQYEVVPRPGLTVEPGRIVFDNLELLFNEEYRPCDVMVFIELFELGKTWCRDLLHLEVNDTLHVFNPNSSQDYMASTGYGVWRLFKLQGDTCQVQPVAVLTARTLLGHAAVSLATRWNLQKNVGDALPPWLEHGLAAYIADEGVHLNNYMAQFRPAGQVLLSPSQIDSILAGLPNSDPGEDRRLFREATYSAFVMVWHLVENHGGLDPLRELLAGLSSGESLDAACRKSYHTDLKGLTAQLDPLVVGEPIGDAVQPRKPHLPPDS